MAVALLAFSMSRTIAAEAATLDWNAPGACTKGCGGVQTVQTTVRLQSVKRALYCLSDSTEGPSSLQVFEDMLEGLFQSPLPRHGLGYKIVN
jgi:hypothetical protein